MIRLEKVSETNRDAVADIYAEAFPRDEKLPFGYLLNGGDGVDFCAATEDGETVGLTCVLHDESLAFLFYFAVRGDLRGKGYGTRILEAVKARHAGRAMIADVEEPVEGCENYEQRARRLEFYRRSGFVLLKQQLLEGPNLFSLMSTDPDVVLKEPRLRAIVKNVFGGAKKMLVDFYVRLYE